ncbi:TetR/AcrR family transcriptional regulator [Amycolatopsis sp. NPDC059657]|uniref:TetR/AcrR family transcriptional regulator n=1 Tax=Amycolatopsis sp. NPDC059657 TaxID=3346899 RepID=UPI00366DE6B4
MVSRSTGSSRLGRPAKLSQEAIVAAAQLIVDEEGPGQLSMRRLAKELSSTPMALYHHVRDKDELLLLLLDAHAARFPRPEQPEEPRARFLTAAGLLYEVLVGCPWIVEVLASDDLMAVSALWIVEDILDSAIACGLSETDAVYAYRTIWYYTAGELLIRVTRNRRRALYDGPSHRDKAFAALDPEVYPRLTSMAANWSELTERDTHKRGLEDIVDGILARCAP